MKTSEVSNPGVHLPEDLRPSGPQPPAHPEVMVSRAGIDKGDPAARTQGRRRVPKPQSPAGVTPTPLGTRKTSEVSKTRRKTSEVFDTLKTSEVSNRGGNLFKGPREIGGMDRQPQCPIRMQPVDIVPFQGRSMDVRAPISRRPKMGRQPVQPRQEVIRRIALHRKQTVRQGPQGTGKDLRGFQSFGNLGGLQM